MVGWLQSKFSDLRGLVSSTATNIEFYIYLKYKKNIQKFDCLRSVWNINNEVAGEDTRPRVQAFFTVFGGYINAINPFVCEEDMIFNIVNFRQYLRNRKLTDKNNVGIDYYLGALQNQTSKALNIFQINQRLNAYFIAQRQLPTNSIALSLPQGVECGCCGNYSGTCDFWSSVCLAHDMACQQCQWDLCFAGCVPSSCSGNTIAWYWFLV